MKQAFGIFAALILMPSFQVQAWVGGPWSNDSYQSNGDDGIYEAIGTLTDGTAMYRWAVNNNNAGGVQMVGGQSNAALTSNVQFGGLVGAQSPHVVWYRGIVYYGRCFGIVNSNMGQVLVTGNASNDGLNGGSGQMNGVDLNAGATSGLTGLASGQGTAVIPARKTLANSTWKAKIHKSFPNKRFHGHGTISFVGDPDFDLVLTSAGTGNPNSAGTTVSVTPISSRSSDSNFPSEGHRVGMKIFGTQVSLTVNG